MKIQKISLLSLFILFGMMSSCKKDINLENFNNEEAAEIIANAIKTATNGITEEFKDITTHITDTVSENFECDMTIDSSFTKNTKKASISAEYDIIWNWTPKCNDLGKMTSLAFNSNMNGGYTGLKANGKGDKTTVFDITGTNKTASQLIYNGTSTNSSTQTVKVRTSKTVGSKIDMTIKELTLEKLSAEISTGTINFTMEITPENDSAINFDGNIVFKGNKSATITVNGETFEISL